MRLVKVISVCAEKMGDCDAELKLYQKRKRLRMFIPFHLNNNIYRLCCATVVS